MYLYTFVAILLASLSFHASANPDQTATITRAFGKVQILYNPSTTIKGDKPHVSYNKRYYHVKRARRGDKIENGNLIQTGKASRVRLVYRNGDQVLISPETVYQITWNEDKRTPPKAELVMGKIRAMVRKNGPRAKMQVKTRTAAMGVRGTDFFVDARTKSGESKVTVLRGKVAVKPQSVKAKAIEVPAGFSARMKFLVA